MAQVISITFTESSEQIVFGIPRTIALDTSQPATIFYTLDGTAPTTSSSVYVSEIEMPTNHTSVTLKVFATDGTDTSPIISETYQPDVSVLHRPWDKAVINSTGKPDMYPYGDNSQEPPATYGESAGDIMHTPTGADIPSGYDGTGTGTPAGETDKPLNTYELKFSETNAIGERGAGIGTLPSTTTVLQPTPPPISTDANSRFFNPRALVIHQDNTKPFFDDNLSQINRQYFSLENAEKVKDGTLYTTSAIDGLAPTGSFLRAHYNSKDNTLNYYYFDSQTLRWIISKEPYQASGTVRTGLFNMIFLREGPGTGTPISGGRLLEDD